MKQKQSTSFRLHPNVAKAHFLLCALFILVGIPQLGYAQEKKIRISQDKTATVDQVFEIINKQTNYRFIYKANLFENLPPVQLKKGTTTVQQLLQQTIPSEDFSLYFKDNTIEIAKIEKAPKATTPQKVTMQGKVIESATNMGIPGVNVTVKGQPTEGVATDIEGNYTLTVSKDAVLIFSAVGMKTIEIPADKASKVVMQEDTSLLDEVVVVGYGTQKKINLTGTVNTVKTDEIQGKAVTSLANALQGVVPGVTVISRPGDVGDGLGTINIRGRGNLGASSPLFVVDGVPVTSGYFQRISPSDIESISILKDASASAIYGARAAFGVFIVTTKKGKEGKATINYNAYYGWQSPTVLPKKLRSLDFANLTNEANINAGKGAIYSADEIAKIKSGNYPDLYPDNDWYSLVYKDSAPITEHNISVQGGGKTRYFVSGSFFEQKSLVQGKKLNRYSLRANTEREFSPIFTLGTNISLLKDEHKRTSGNFSRTNIDRMTPLTVAKHSDGTWGSVTAGKESSVLAKNNPLRQLAEYGRGHYDVWRLNSSINATLKPIEGLEVTGVLSYNYFNKQESAFDNTVAPIIGFISKKELNGTNLSPNKLTKTWQTHSTFMAQAYATYKKEIGLHYGSIMVGTQYEDYDWEKLKASRKDFPSNDLGAIDAGSGKAENLGNSGRKEERAFLSQFARLNYAYANKYLFEANIRFDQSSQFHKDNRLGIFPSFSAAWRLTEEDFLKNVKWLSNLKIRASWGKLGNTNNVGYYDYLDVLAVGTATIMGESKVDGVWPSRQSNKNLSWEEVNMTNLGIDASFFESKLQMQLDIFNKITNDILLKTPTPLEMGLVEEEREGLKHKDERTPVNAGSVENKGFELMLSYKDNIGEFNYGISANVSRIWNKITDLNGLDNQISTPFINKEGESVGSFYMYQAEGLFKDQAEIDAHAKQGAATKPGDIKYKDINEDGIINAEDRKIVGNDVPYFTYGIGFNASYKGFDFSLQGQGVKDVKVYLSGEAAFAFFNGAGAKEFHLKRWTKENPDPQAAYPRVLPSSNNSHNQIKSSFWLFNADYFRIKNLTLGYTLPKAVSKKIGLSKTRFYVSGTNLFTLRGDKRMKDFDPEAPSKRNAYPSMKVVSLGVNISF